MRRKPKFSIRREQEVWFFKVINWFGQFVFISVGEKKSWHTRIFPGVLVSWGILALHKYKFTNTFTESGQLQPCFLQFLGTHLHHSFKRKMLKRKKLHVV